MKMTGAEIIVNTLIEQGVTDVFGSKSNAQQFAENLKAVSDGFPDTVLRLISNL